MLRLVLVLILVCIATIYSVPISTDSMTPEDEFYRSLEPDGNFADFMVMVGFKACVLNDFVVEQKALMQMGIEGAIVERGIETSITEVKLTVPETLRQSINVSPKVFNYLETTISFNFAWQAKTDPTFQQKLIAWIGREWNLSDRALLDLQMSGRGCRDDGTCVTVYDMDHTCCPFG